MNRETLAWLVSIALIFVVAMNLSGSLGQRDDDYAFVRTLIDIHRQVADNYVDPVDENELRQKAIEGMLGELDPYTVYVPPAEQQRFDRMLGGNFVGVGINLDQKPTGEVTIITPIAGSPAYKAGVRAGDVIVKVDGKEVEKDAKIDDVIDLIKGEAGTPVTLTVRHPDGQVEALKMDRQDIRIPVVKGWKYLSDDSDAWDYWITRDPNIAYVRLAQFTPGCAEAVKGVIEQLLKRNLQGLILDLRYNPGGQLDEAVKLVDALVSKGVIVSTKGRNRPESIAYATAAGTLADFPMVVLVNEHSASAAEVVSGALKDDRRAVIVGTRTFGKGSVQEVVPLEGDSGELKITVAHYYLPSGRLVHRKPGATDWGVQPQIDVPMDEATQAAVMKVRFDDDLLRGDALPSPATSRAASQPTTGPSTRPVDVQLRRAVEVLTAMAVLKEKPVTGPPLEVAPLDEEPSTRPVTLPMTRPAA